MQRIIKALFLEHRIERKRKYELTRDSLEEYANLRPATRQLLWSMLDRIKYGNILEDVIVEVTSADLNMDRKLFSKYRKELVDAGFIVYERKQHYINLNKINYHGRRQFDAIERFFNLKNDIKPSWENSNSDK